MNITPEQCRNQNKHFKAEQDHENIQSVIPKWVCLLKAFEQVVCTTLTLLVTCKVTKYQVHTYRIFNVWGVQRDFPGLLQCACTYFWKWEEKKKVPTLSFITKWRASSGFTHLYNEMILCLITEEERMKCTYIMLCKMFYGWSDMCKQQNLFYLLE